MIYDTIIIGAGLSGLINAGILAKEGQKVCVLEKNPIPGGMAQNFKFKHNTFDPAAHYLGGTEKGQSLYAYFNYLGLTNKLTLKKMDEKAFDRIRFTDGQFVFAQRENNFTERLSNDFPKEAANIKAFTELMRKTALNFPGFNLQNPTNPDPHIFKANAYDTIAQFTKNRRLQNVLFGNSPAYDGRPESTPFYIYALLTYSYIESAYRVVGGSGQIAEILAENFKKNGGDIRYNYKVEKIITDAEGLPMGTENADGEQILAKRIISSTHPSELLRQSPAGLFRKSYRRRINSLENSTGVFSIYAVLKEGIFPFLNSANYCYQSSAEDAHKLYSRNRFGEKIIVLTQPLSQKQEFAKTIQIITPMPYSAVQKFEDSKVRKRGKEYRQFKKEKAAELLENTEFFFPGLRDALLHFDTATPLSFRDYTASAEGSAYGIRKDSRNMLLSNISHRTKIPNLFIAGQSANIHGLHGTAAGAFMVCSDILGEDYLRHKMIEG